MSLINDALKRAKETQPQGAAAEGPSLQHVPMSRTARPDFLLPMLALVIVLLTGLLFWAWSQSGGMVKVRANSFPETPSPAPQPASAPVAPAVSQVAPSLIEATTNVVMLAPVAAAPIKPEPPTYKLQGIFYSKHPSAVINGKTVFAGSRIGDARVAAIGTDSATLVLGNGETKILEMP